MRRWWQGLETRERTIVSAGGAFVLIVAIYLVLWEPAANGIRKLDADLPALREQDAAMRAMAAEATALRAAAGAAAPTPLADRSAAVRRSLERAGLWRATAATAAPLPVSALPAPARVLGIGGATGGTSAIVGPAQSATRTTPPEVAADGERVRVRFDDIDYGVWAGWLAAAETELAARATRVTIVSASPKGAVGHVRAEALLDWTAPAASTPSSAPRP